MRFVLHQASLNAGDEALAMLDRIVDRIADEVHVAELADPDLFESSDWCKTARQTRRRVLVAAATRPPRVASSELHQKQVEVRDGNDVQVASKLAYAPLTVLVEDREADGVLLDILMLKVAAPELRTLWEMAKVATPRGIEIDTAGGIDAMPQRIRRALEDSTLEGRPPRLFTLCDSDARWPRDNANPSSASIEKIREICEAEQLPAHVLSKRNAENYIPDTVFEAAKLHPNNKAHIPRFDAFFRRSAVQRDHFPVKSGLSDDERALAVNEGLYSGAEIADLELLKERLMPKRPRLLMRIYEEYLDEITAESIEARDGVGEVLELINKLRAEL